MQQHPKLTPSSCTWLATAIAECTGPLLAFAALMRVLQLPRHNLGVKYCGACLETGELDTGHARAVTVVLIAQQSTSWPSNRLVKLG